eukprot:scaffold1158_cov66-Phaeocystis_antarctica.AAC.1
MFVKAADTKVERRTAFERADPHAWPTHPDMLQNSDKNPGAPEAPGRAHARQIATDVRRAVCAPPVDKLTPCAHQRAARQLSRRLGPEARRGAARRGNGRAEAIVEHGAHRVARDVEAPG